MWLEESPKDSGQVEGAVEPEPYPSRLEASSQWTPSPTPGWQMAFPSLSSRTDALWLDARTVLSRHSVDLDRLFLEGILVSGTS